MHFFGCCTHTLHPFSSPVSHCVTCRLPSKLTEDRHDNTSICTVVGHSPVAGRLSVFDTVHRGDDSDERDDSKTPCCRHSSCLQLSEFRLLREPTGRTMKPAGSSVKQGGLMFSVHLSKGVVLWIGSNLRRGVGTG